jgi:hypothetical protein
MLHGLRTLLQCSQLLFEATVKAMIDGPLFGARCRGSLPPDAASVAACTSELALDTRKGQRRGTVLEREKSRSSRVTFGSSTPAVARRGDGAKVSTHAKVRLGNLQRAPSACYSSAFFHPLPAFHRFFTRQAEALRKAAILSGTTACIHTSPPSLMELARANGLWASQKVRSPSWCSCSSNFHGAFKYHPFQVLLAQRHDTSSHQRQVVRPCHVGGNGKMLRM